MAFGKRLTKLLADSAKRSAQRLKEKKKYASEEADTITLKKGKDTTVKYSKERPKKTKKTTDYGPGRYAKGGEVKAKGQGCCTRTKKCKMY